MRPRYHVGQWVTVEPAGLVFDGERYRGQIVRGPLWDSSFAAWEYVVDVYMPHQRQEAPLFEPEIIGPASEEGS